MDCGHVSVHFRRLVGAGVMTAILATVFVPAMAAQQAPPNDPSAFSNKSIARVVANTTSEDLVRSERTAAEAPKKAQAGRSGSFFKTRTGLVVLAVMAVGTGYAVYSAKEDRIKGINR